MKTGAIRLAIVAAFASLALVIPAGSAQAYPAPFCQNASHDYLRSIPAHTICSERVVGRFSIDYAFGFSESYGLWAKDYIVRPFGLPEVVLQTTYYKQHLFGTRLTDGWLHINIPHGLDSNHVICGAVANISDRTINLSGAYDNGLAAKYNLNCDQAVSKFTGLPVVN